MKKSGAGTILTHLRKKQEGEGGRQLVPGEEGDEGGIELKEVVQGWSTSSMLKKKWILV